MNFSRSFAIPFLFASFAFWPSANGQTSGDSGDGPVHKKLIGFGWDSPSPAEFVQNLAAIEESPFDGVRVLIKRETEDGTLANLRSLFTSTPWKKEWFAEDIATLRKVKSKKLTDNFLTTGPGPLLDWFDDAAWKIAVEHAAIAAYIAKEGGLKGLVFDPELGRPMPPFDFHRIAAGSSRTFDEYAAKVRQRGREVMTAWRQEFPDMVLFTLFLNSGLALSTFGEDPRAGIENSPKNSLYPAFVNGWLDALGPEMLIVDGNEHSYPHSDDFQYLKRANATRNTSLALIASENHRKYRSQVSCSLALYMDAYCVPLDNPHSDVFTDPPLTGTLSDRLRKATAAARDCSDEYVWVWGEQYRWWPTSAPRVRAQSWDDILPGASQALREGMNPHHAALLRANSEFTTLESKVALRGMHLKNLLQNPSFAPTAEPGKKKQEATLPAHWAISPDTPSPGTLGYDASFSYQGRDNGAASLTGLAEGFFSQEIEVTPFSFYKFRCRVRQTGEGAPVVRLTWLGGNTEGSELGTESLEPSSSPRNAWERVETVTRAPAGATKLRIQIGVKGQKDNRDIVWYDAAEVYRISVN